MAQKRRRLTVTACHLVRAGQGLDALHLCVRGHGFVFGATGLRLVWGQLERVLVRRFSGPRARVFFVGLHGLSFASVELPKAVRLWWPAPLSPRLPSVRGELVPRVPTEAVPVRRAQVPMVVSAPAVPDDEATPSLLRSPHDR